MQDDDESVRIRATILDYLAQNHDAADTVRGIMSCWLPPQDGNADRAIVERVLEELAAEGFIAVTRLADGAVVYRRLSGV